MKAIFFFLSLFIIGSVVAEDTCIKHEDHKAAIFFLVDRTDELVDIENFRQSFVSVREMVKPGARLLVGTSTGKVSEVKVLFDLVIPEKSLWVSTLKLRAQEKQFDDCLTKVQNNLINTKESYTHSAILETLAFVSKILGADASVEKKLVMYSDMVQNSPTLSFLDSKPFNTQSALQLVEKERLLSKLDGVQVFAAGVGTHVSEKRAREIEDFWTKYWEKSGAKLQFYGPVLVGS